MKLKAMHLFNNFFFLFNRCFIHDFKYIYIYFFLVRLSELLKNFYKINKINFIHYLCFLDDKYYYLFCRYSRYNVIYVTGDYLDKFIYYSNFIAKIYYYFIIVELKFSFLNFNFFYKPQKPKIYTFYDFHLKVDYLSFIYLRNYLTYYKAFIYNFYIFEFLHRFFLDNLIDLFKIMYWSLGRVQKYYPLLMRRVFRENMFFNRYLVYRYYVDTVSIKIKGLKFISKYFVRANGNLIFFLMLNASLFFLYFAFFRYFIFLLLYYLLFNSLLTGNLWIFSYHLLNKSRFARMARFVYGFFLMWDGIKLSLFRTMFKNFSLNFFKYSMDKSLMFNYLVINNLLKKDATIDVHKTNINRFFYRINLIFLMDYISVAFHDNFWDLDLMYDLEDVLWYLGLWFMEDTYRFSYVTYLYKDLNIYNLFDSYKITLDYLLWFIFNANFYFKFYYFYINFFFYLKKLDIDNILSYDYLQISIYTDLFFKKIFLFSNNILILIQASLIFICLRDYFLKFIEFYKIILFLKNFYICVNLYNFVSLVNKRKAYYLLRYHSLSGILNNFRQNFSFDYNLVLIDAKLRQKKTI